MEARPILMQYILVIVITIGLLFALFVTTQPTELVSKANIGDNKVYQLPHLRFDRARKGIVPNTIAVDLFVDTGSIPIRAVEALVSYNPNQITIKPEQVVNRKVFSSYRVVIEEPGWIRITLFESSYTANNAITLGDEPAQPIATLIFDVVDSSAKETSIDIGIDRQNNTASQIVPANLEREQAKNILQHTYGIIIRLR